VEPDDIPSPIDLCDPATARTWASEADAKRPWRARFREAFAEQLAASAARIVVELGCGPGLLAEHVLRQCAIDRYTLLDFSQPMLDLARDRIGDHAAARFVLADFKQPAWTDAVEAPVQAVITMQAVHELRHKRHAVALYRGVRSILSPGGALLVCDHEPFDPRGLYSTEAEQHAAFAAAGFTEATTLLRIEGMYLCRAR
jgi:ubiquinone/menaquinone biosynthesis C-methylase UbiE